MKSYTKIYLFCFIFGCSCNSTQSPKIIGKDAGTKTNEELLKSKANMLYEQDKYVGAINYFDSLIHLDSTNGEYYFKRGYSYVMLIKKNKAIDDFKKAIICNYRVNQAYYNIGVEYSYMNDSLALLNFEKCLAIDPSFSKAYIDIEDCKKRLKER